MHVWPHLVWLKGLCHHQWTLSYTCTLYRLNECISNLKSLGKIEVKLSTSVTAWNIIRVRFINKQAGHMNRLMDYQSQLLFSYKYYLSAPPYLLWALDKNMLRSKFSETHIIKGSDFKVYNTTLMINIIYCLSKLSSWLCG